MEGKLVRKRESRPHVSGRVELLDDLVDRRRCHGVLCRKDMRRDKYLSVMIFIVLEERN